MLLESTNNLIAMPRPCGWKQHGIRPRAAPSRVRGGSTRRPSTRATTLGYRARPSSTPMLLLHRRVGDHELAVDDLKLLDVLLSSGRSPQRPSGRCPPPWRGAWSGRGAVV